MLRILETPRALPQRHGMKTLGGPGKVTEAMLDKCFRRLAGMVKLQVLTIEAEFPKWEVLSAFSAFDLERTERADEPIAALDGHDYRRKSLQRISQVFGLGFQVLWAEFMDHLPIASAELVRHPELSSTEAWRRVTIRTADRRLRQRHCLLYTSPSPRDQRGSRMPSSA